MKNKHFEDLLESLSIRIANNSKDSRTHFGSIKNFLCELEVDDSSYCYMSRIDNEKVFKNSLFLMGVSSEFQNEETYKLELNSLYIHLLHDVINEFSIQCANSSIIDLFKYAYDRRYIKGKTSSRYKLFLNMFYGIVASSKFDLIFIANSEVTETLTDKLKEILEIVGIDNILAIDTDVIFVKRIDFVDELRQTFQYFNYATVPLGHSSHLTSTYSFVAKRLQNNLNNSEKYEKFREQFS